MTIDQKTTCVVLSVLHKIHAGPMSDCDKNIGSTFLDVVDRANRIQPLVKFLYNTKPPVKNKLDIKSTFQKIS